MISKIVFLEPKNERLNIFSGYVMPRLGTLLLATIMKKRGFETSVYFMKKKEIIAQNLKPDLVGISTITATAPQAYMLCDYYRAMGIPVVIGGPHVTFLPDEAIEHADYVVMGEGEIPFPMLVDALNNNGSLEEVPGLVYRKDNRVYKNPVAEPVCDLDQLPFTDFSLLHTKESGLKRSFARQQIQMQTSRGCPFDCSFCSVTGMFGKQYRYRSSDHIMNEISQYDPAKNTFFFYDDNFTANRKRTKELLQKMIDSGKKFSWSTQVRCDIAKDSELLDMMKKAGCNILYIGFESVDPDSLKEMKKKQTVADIAYAISEIRKRHIHIHGMFVFGFEQDTMKKIQATVKFAIKHRIDTVQFLILTPLPGTEFYADMRAQGRIIDYKWDTYDAHHVKFRPKNMHEWELQTAQMIAHTRFYSPHHILGRIFRGRMLAAMIGIYANSLNRQWKKIEKEYLYTLRLMFMIEKSYTRAFVKGI